MEAISKYRFDLVTLEIMNNFEVLKKHEEEIPEEVRNAKKRNAETMEDTGAPSSFAGARKQRKLQLSIESSAALARINCIGWFCCL